MGDAHHKESGSSNIESSIYPKGTQEAFSQTRRPTDVPASTFYLVKLVENDDHVAPVITKWLSQDLVILFFSVTTELTGLQRLIGWLLQLQG